jgi:hypothetical protein
VPSRLFAQDHPDADGGMRFPKKYAAVQFVQIGTDEGAKRFLDMLDNDYKGHEFDDFVDTTHWDAIIRGRGSETRERLIACMILKCTMGALLHALCRMSIAQVACAALLGGSDTDLDGM